jgi:hypothetical protein
VRVAKNPPSFILVDKETGDVVYTKRATGVGSEAIRKCVEKGRALTARTGRTYFVYLDIMGAKVGMKLSVPMAYALGITEEIGPKGSAMPSGRKCCFAPDVRPSGQGMRCMNCQRWEADNYLKNPRRAPVRRNIYAFNNPPSGPADPTAARELELYISNDSQLYHSQFIPIVKNLMLKRRKGVYNRELTVKLFMYLMDAGAKKYVREFGTGGNIDTMFNKNTRMAAARAFRDSFETEAELGNYDRMIGPVSNPLNRKEVAQVINMSRDIARTAIRAKKLGDASRAKANLAYGRGMLDVSMTFSPQGTRKGVRNMLDRYNTIERRESSRSNPSIRENIYTFNNPRKLNAMERAASLFNLSVATWAPGDGLTRYRFFKASGHGPYADYHQGGAIYTANGRGEAIKFLKAYGVGRSRMNPSPHDPSGLAELDARMNDLMRRMDAMKKSGTDNRPEYMILLKEAQAVSQKRLALIGLGSTSIQKGFTRRNPCSNPTCRIKKHGHVRQNPILQTIFLANPPISAQWDRLTGRQRLQVLGFVGFEETASRYVRLPWKLLSSMVREALEQYWLDSTSTRGTTRRRMAPVGANPLTRREAGRIIGEAKRDIRYGSGFRSGEFTRTVSAGQAFGKSKVVRKYGPKSAGRAAAKIADKAHKMAGTIFSNPGVSLPRPGTKLTISQALDLAERLGNRELVKQCHAAMKLQKAANKDAKCVIWKVFPMGSKDKIDSVVALTHYGDSPETMYKPPPGSKKGNHMYRHNWGEKGGKQSVPLLASPDGKMLMMPLEGRKVASDWLRH